VRCIGIVRVRCATTLKGPAYNFQRAAYLVLQSAARLKMAAAYMGKSVMVPRMRANGAARAEIWCENGGMRLSGACFCRFPAGCSLSLKNLCQIALFRGIIW